MMLMLLVYFFRLVLFCDPACREMVRWVNQIFAPVQRNGNVLLNQILEGRNNFMTPALIKSWPQSTLRTIKPLKVLTKTALLCSSEINLEQGAPFSFVRDFSHSSASQSRDSDNR